MIPFDNTYARLPSHFYVRQNPIPVKAPRLLKLNAELLESLGLSATLFSEETWAAIFAGNRVPQGAEPLAMAYAGHQFGHFVPSLGDGRALLLGEVLDRNGIRRDIHLKGAGRTAFSRNGDGRCPLGPALREYLISEAFHGLGIPATRSLAVVHTGETVLREVPLPGAVLTRVASGHVRVGTFEYFAARGDGAAVRTLSHYVIHRFFPDLEGSPSPVPALFERVLDCQADLVARWMHVGFIHGVMNTDNCALSGETMDFGPCAFMDNYHPDRVFSSIDSRGRYAYANQPRIVHWNLARFAETLLSPDDGGLFEELNVLLQDFPRRFEAYWLSGMRRKLGFFTEEPGDAGLVQDLFRCMEAHGADFTLAFRLLSDLAGGFLEDSVFVALFENSEACRAWLAHWRRRLGREGMEARALGMEMRRVNPAVIPRNHRVEAALRAAEKGDMTPFEDLLCVLRHPFEVVEGFENHALPPEPGERVLKTFCGT
jgi:uncharacterized protein YdiU (UPF0061 family)